jgi:hypothetical protein
MKLGSLLRDGDHQSAKGGIRVFKKVSLRLTPNEDFCRVRVSVKFSEYVLILDSVH